MVINSFDMMIVFIGYCCGIIGFVFGIIHKLEIIKMNCKIAELESTIQKLSDDASLKGDKLMLINENKM